MESFGISSTGNSLFVKFESAGSGEYTGFLAEIHYGNPHMNISNNNFKFIVYSKS